MEDQQEPDFDAYRPGRIAQLIEISGTAKAHLPLLKMFTLAVLAGVFIALGCMFYLATLIGAEPVTGLHKFAGGIAFSLGLILVVVGGAELFTGNALITMAFVDGRISFGLLMRNWGWSFWAMPRVRC